MNAPMPIKQMSKLEGGDMSSEASLQLLDFCD